VSKEAAVVYSAESESIYQYLRNVLGQQQQSIGVSAGSALVGDSTGYPIGSVRSLSSNAAAVKVKLAPNLKIDSRSSFAPPRKFDAPKVPPKKECLKTDIENDTDTKVSPDSDIQDQDDEEEEDELDYDSDDEDLDFGMLQDEHTTSMYAVPFT
jgi:hypothetical protein